MLKKALKLNTLSVASQGAVLLAGVLFAVIMTRLIPIADYGLLTSFVSFVVFIALVSDMGLRTTATKYVGAAFFAKDARLQKYVSQLMFWRFAIVIVIGVGISLFSGEVATAVLHSPDYYWLFQITGITAILYSAMHFFEGLVSASNRYEYTFAGSVIVNGARLFLPIVLVLLFTPTAHLAIVGVALAYLLGALAYLFFFKRIYGKEVSLRKGINHAGGMEKEIRQYAFYAAIMALAGAVLTNFDPVLLNMFLTPDKVALYKAAQMVFIGVITLAPISYLVMFTFFVELEATGKRKEQAETYSQAAKYGLAFFIPISVMMFVLAGEIVGFLFPPTYAAAALALQVFAVIPAFYFLFNINSNVLLARGEIKSATVLSLLAGAASLILNVTLIPLFGFIGSAMAYAGACLIPAALSFPMTKGKLSMSIGSREVARPLLVSALAGALVMVVRQFVSANQLLLIALFPLACAGVYLLLLDEDDRRVLNALRSLVKKA
ncbi:Polysaccharide biosynthesis protein [Candidatus Burarchaeum australiense]|nr:Polysaccharide biosynthesis protein [Candidatus Burarchaeum australiense]